jgi:hypothetical protein
MRPSFIQFEVTDPDEYEAFLWHEPHDVDDKGRSGVIGACCFKRRRRHDLPSPIWAMQWIWFHPYRRRRGLLKRTWPYFRHRYGRFFVEGPHSHGMMEFLKQTNHNAWSQEWSIAARMPSPPMNEKPAQTHPRRKSLPKDS